MKKQALFRLLKAVLFCALLALCISTATRLVQRKSSINRISPLLEQPEACDVLFVGNSHMVNCVFPQELWRQYGISAYNAASHGNTMPVTYWTARILMEHYLTPRLIVIDVKDVGSDEMLSVNSADVHMALDCFPLSLTKALAIEDLMNHPGLTDDEGSLYRDLRPEFYFTLGKYHTRWCDLNEYDFHPQGNNHRGAEMAVGVDKPRDYSIIDSSTEEYGAGYAYLRRLIEECQRRGVEVLLTHLPYPATEWEQATANTVQYIARDYGVGFVDFVSLDQVVDYSTDCFDYNSHQNASGAQKVTDYLGRYLRDHYDLPDRSGDAACAASYDAYYAEKLAQLRAQTRPENALLLLHDSSVSAVIAIAEDSPVYRSDALLTLLHNTAREHVYEEDEFAKWSSAMFPLETMEDAAAAASPCVIVLDRGSGAVSQFAGYSAQADTSFGALSAQYADGAFSLTIAQEGGEAFQADSDADLLILAVDARTGEIAATLPFSL